MPPTCDCVTSTLIYIQAEGPLGGGGGVTRLAGASARSSRSHGGRWGLLGALNRLATLQIWGGGI